MCRWTRCGSFSERGGVSRCVIRIDEWRQTGERAVRHVAFSTVRSANFHVAFYAARDLDRFSALQFCRHVKRGQRIVNPDAVMARVAFHGGAVSCERRLSGRGSYEEKKDSESIIHFDPLIGWDCGIRFERAADKLAMVPNLTIFSGSNALQLFQFGTPNGREQLYGGSENEQAKVMSS